MWEEQSVEKLYIWGAGDIGKRILEHLDNKWEIVFVDSNTQLAGTHYCGRKIISVNEYLEKHSEEFILIAHLYENESINILHDNNIINYFTHCDLPAEFNEPYVRSDLKEYIINYLKNRENYILYGLNIYSIIIYDWIYKTYGYRPYILPQDNISKQFIDKISQHCKDLKLITSIKELDNIEEVCICTNNYSELIVGNTFDEYCVTDIFDCSDKIDSYYNPAIEKFHDIHKGQRCFIVATGPSLKTEDLDLLKCNKELCISMNSIFYAFDKTDWRPNYYVMADHRGLNEYEEVLDTLPVKYKFLSDSSKSFWEIAHRKNVFRFHQHYEYYFDRLPKFSDDFSSKSYNGTTVTYTCIQLAVYMGFKNIYLLGVDFSYQEQGEKYLHFHKKDKLVATGFKHQVYLAYLSAAEYAKKNNINIYNVTRGGRLEIFPRVSFDDLFSEHEGRENDRAARKANILNK